MNTNALKALLLAYASHMRAARRERKAGCHLNAAAWTKNALAYRNAYLSETYLAGKSP